MRKGVMYAAFALIGSVALSVNPAAAQYYQPMQPSVAPYYQQQMQPSMYEQPYMVSPQYYQQYLTPVPQVSPCAQTMQAYSGNPNCLYNQGLYLVRRGNYYDAIQVFAQFLQYYPQSSLADNALYWTGESYYAMRQYSTALAYFQQIQAQYPRGNKVPDSLLKTALCYFSMRQNAAGCQAISTLLSYYPKSESARKAWRWSRRCGLGGNCYQQDPCSGAYMPQTQYQQPSYYPTYQPQSYPMYPSYPSYNDASFPKNY